MDANTIRTSLRRQPLTRKYFQDVIGADELPNVKNQKGIYVVNTHPINLPGEHWVTIEYLDTTVVYYDPLGLSTHPTILKHLRKSGALKKRQLIHNTTRFQGQRLSCGLYCIYNILSRCSRRHSMRVFSNDLDFNDRLVYKIVRQHFDVC